MLSFFERVKTWWTTADPKQKVVTLGGIGALLLVLVGTVAILSRPHFVPLYEKLSDTDSANVIDALNTAKIPNQLGGAGVVEVPEGQRDAARMALAKDGKAPKGPGHWGPTQLLSANPMAPPGMENEVLNTVREGEIASALETYPGVASATVLITTPKERLFAENESRPTASVSLVESGDGGLTPAIGRIFANLVCSAVDGMTPADVVVATNSGTELWDGRNGGLATDKWDQDKKVAHDVQRQVQEALDFTMGKGNTQVLVRADVDTDKQTTHKRTVDPTAKPIAVVKDTESAQGVRKGASGVAGSASNTVERTPTSPPDGGSGVGTYEKKGTQQEFDKNETEEETTKGEGGLKGLAITVLANSDKVPDESKVKDVVNGVMGGLIQTDASGTPILNQPFTTKVTSFKFDPGAQQTVKDATDRLAGQQRMQQLLSLLPIAAILAVALLVAKQVGKISKAVLPPAVEETAALAEGPSSLDGGEGAEALGAGSPLSLPGSAGVHGAVGAHGAVGPNGEPLPEQEVAMLPETIRDRIDLPLESLKQMATERPEMVATLIKSVLLGERH